MKAAECFKVVLYEILGTHIESKTLKIMRIYRTYILASGRQFSRVLGFAAISDGKSGHDRNKMHGKHALKP